MDPPGIVEVHLERLATILVQRRQEIYDTWISALRQKWTGPATRKLSFLEQKIAVHQDLLSLLIAGARKSEASYHHIAPLINLDCITSQEYSVLDIFDEAVLLEDSLVDCFRDLQISGDEREQLKFMVRNQILALQKGLLWGTAELLSCLVEGGKRGYCQVDEKGRIVCVNREMQRLLGEETVVGAPLEAFFPKKDQNFIAKSYLDLGEELPAPQMLLLVTHLKPPVPVGTEVGAIVMGGQRRGGYACLVDLRHRQQTQLEIFEQLPVGLAQVDPKGNFLYANRKFLEILGIEDQGWLGQTLFDFLPNQEARDRVESEIQKRQHGDRGEYEVTFTRKSGDEVPVKIYAVPETDLEGKVTGSVAIVRSLERDKAVARMHEHMATRENWQEMLTQVIREVKPFIPYDLCLVSEISPDQKHIRRLLTEPPVQDAISHKIGRWQVPDKMNQWLKKHREIYFDDLEVFLSQPDFAELKENPQIQWFIQQGYRCFIRLPIIQDNPIASVSFLSKTLAYDKTHQELLDALAPPLDKAIRLAFSRQKEAEFKFFFELLKKISAEGNDFRKVAETLVDGLSDHYKWGNVSLFRADEGLNCFLLLYQKNSPGMPAIPKGYTQPLNKGILGYVYRTGEDVNTGDVKHDPRFKDIYVSLWKEPGRSAEEDHISELCLRLATKNACFLLNIEDLKQNAFSDEELNALRMFRNEAAAILERSWLYHYLTAALKSTSDAVIGTDRKGRIISINPAAALLLGYTDEEMQQKIRAEKDGLFLKDYFKDPKVAEKAIKEKHFSSLEVVWVNRRQEPVNLLLSASVLREEEFGGKIFTAKNLADRDRVQHLEHLGKLYQEIAIQMKTPLSLAFAWLKPLAQKDPQSQEGKTLSKVIKQLRKVDLTFDRLCLCDYDEQEGWFPTRKMLLSLDEVLRQVENDLSDRDWERIVDSSTQPLPNLWGDLFQLTFCVETILSHLLGVIPEDERIQMQVSSSDGRINLEFSGVCPEIPDSQLSRALAGLALGENIIRRFMKNHDGEFQKEIDGNRTVFRLNLPAAQGESP